MSAEAKRFARQCAGDDREYTPEEEKAINKRADERYEMLKAQMDKKNAKSGK